MAVERRSPAVRHSSDYRGGRGGRVKTPIDRQDLRRKIYAKAKAETAWRFWGLYVHVCKLETLHEAYLLAKKNNGAPGIDGVTFEAIEDSGVAAFLTQLRDELAAHTYRPMRNRRQEIPIDVSLANESFSIRGPLIMYEQTPWNPRRTRTPPTPGCRPDAPGRVPHRPRAHPRRRPPLPVPLAAGGPLPPRRPRRHTPPRPHHSPQRRPTASPGRPVAAGRHRPRLGQRAVDRPARHRSHPPPLRRLLPPRARPQDPQAPPPLKQSEAAGPGPGAQRGRDPALVGPGVPAHRRRSEGARRPPGVPGRVRLYADAHG